MLTFEETQEALTEIADRVPEEIYKGLNGGVVLSPDFKLHPRNVRGDLYIMGEYRYEPAGFGRYITLYYGSLQKLCGHLPREAQLKRLEEVLRHELIHHLEHQAGDITLEVKDAADIARYRRRYKK